MKTFGRWGDWHEWKSAFVYLSGISKGQRRRILLTCLCGIAEAFFSLAFVYASKLIIDVATGASPGKWWVAGLWAAGFLAVRLGLTAVTTWYTNRMEVETANKLRRQLFARLLKTRWNETEQFHSGDLINRVELDVNKVVTLITVSVPALIVTFVRFSAAFVFFFLLDNVLPWITIGILVLCLPLGRLYTYRMRKFTRAIRKHDSKIQSVIQESLQYRTVVKTLEQDAWSVDKLNTLQDELRTQVNRRTVFSVVSNVTLSLAFWGSYLMAFIWGAIKLKAGAITFGTMTAFIQLSGRLQRPAMDMSRLAPTFVDVLTAIERLQELEALPEEEEKQRIVYTSTPDIVLENVSFRYTPHERPVMERLSLSFPAGSHTAVLGKTGAGKTTLIRLLLTLTIPEEGNITLHGKDSKGNKRIAVVSPDTRGNFVYVPQGNTLFSGTIRDNLLMGNPNATDEELHEVLRTAVADFVIQLPQGLDTPLNEKGGGLSEGQAQRIAIARSLLRPGNILLFDEATSALDTKTEAQLMENIKRHYAGKTCIFITHHPELARMCEVSFTL